MGSEEIRSLRCVMGGDGRQAALTMQIKGDISFIDGQTDGVQQRLPVAMADGLRWMA